MAYAVCFLLGSIVSGSIYFTQYEHWYPDVTRVYGTVYDLDPGRYNISIHESEIDDEDCDTAGGYYTRNGRQIGDIGVVRANSRGRVEINRRERRLPIYGSNRIIGRSFVITALGDDDDDDSSGERVACCTIERSYSYW